MLRFSSCSLLFLCAAAGVHLAIASKSYYTITSSTDEPKELGGQMFFLNDNGECLETNLDKKYRNAARSMIEDLIEGGCATEGYEVYKGETTAQLSKPYWLGAEPVPLTFTVNVPTERTLRKWAREEATEKAQEDKLRKEYDDQLARLSPEGRAALQKLDKGETLTDQDKKALEMIEKAEMEKMTNAKNAFRETSDDGAKDGAKAKATKTVAKTDKEKRKAERQAKRAARKAAKKVASKSLRGQKANSAAETKKA